MARRRTLGKLLRVVLISLVIGIISGAFPAMVGADAGVSPQVSGGSISGVVEDESGDPIEGAVVAAISDDFSYFTSDNTGADGSYAIADLATDNYYVAVQADGYAVQIYDGVYDLALATLVPVTEPNDTPNIDFALELGGSISGVVLDESDGEPIEGAWVYAQGDSFGWSMSAYTTADGSYSFTDLVTDSYLVWTQADGYVTEYYDGVYDSISATLVPVTAPNDTPDIDFALGVGGSISGVVLDESDDQPIEGAWVWAEGESLGSWGHAYTGADGSYSITGLTTDNYTVYAEADGYVTEYYDGVYDWDSATLVSVTLPNDTPNIDFTLGTGGSISGVVEDESGDPIEGAYVEAEGDSSGYWGYAYTGADGSYSITGLTTDNYTVYAEADGYVTEYYDGVYDWDSATLVTVTAPNDSPGIDFALGLGGSISGVVLDDSDDPIEGAWVYAYGDSLGFSGYAYTSDNGSYSITGLVTDNYTVWAEADGYVTEYYDGVYDSSAATPVSVTLPNDTPNIDFALAATEDATPPSTPVVTDDGATTTSVSQLHASWTSSDAESGIAEYQYAIGTTAGGTNVTDWTSAGTSTQVTKTGLGLSVGTTYYFSVKAKNGVDSWSEVGVSNGIQVIADSTVPTTPVVTDDGATTTSTSQLHASWTSSDAESGIAEYQYAIGSTSGGTDILGWTSASTSTQVTKTGISLSVGTTYYFSVKAKNGQGLWSGVGISDGIAVAADITAPSTPVVTDDGATTTSTSQLHASWTSSDAESGIVEYQHAIGSTSGGTDILGWTSTGTDTQVTKTGLSLAAGTTYYFSVKAKNGQGLWSGVGVSDGIAVPEATKPSTPVVEKVDPSSGKRKQHLTVTISGANFDGAPTVSFGSGVTVGDISVNSSTEIAVEITIDADATKGTRDVSVTTGSGTGTKTDAFSVVGGGKGVCSGGAPATPGGPSEITTILAALGLLFGVGYWLVRKGTKNRSNGAWA